MNELPIAMFSCEGCGTVVHAVGLTAPPRHGFCSVCLWCNEYLEPREIVEVQRHLNPENWRRDNLV